MARVVRWFSLHKHDFGKSVAMVTTVLGLFPIHSVEIWIWAIVFLSIDAITSFQDALHFFHREFFDGRLRWHCCRHALAPAWVVGSHQWVHLDWLVDGLSCFRIDTTWPHGMLLRFFGENS
jgi:hypothetical protein